MKRMILIFASLFSLMVFNGCTHKSFHPWLGEEFLVSDDRMAGVWQGDCSINKNNPKSGDIVIIRPVEEEIAEDGKDNEIPQGYYSMIYYEDSKMKEPAKIEGAFVYPSRIAGALYELEGVLMAQIWGYTSPGNEKLLTPMYVLYKAEYTGEEIWLHELNLSGLEAEELSDAGLLVEDQEEAPYLFFSKTEELSAYILEHLQDDGFFSEEPSIHLKRISDLRLPQI